MNCLLNLIIAISANFANASWAPFGSPRSLNYFPGEKGYVSNYNANDGQNLAGPTVTLMSINVDGANITVSSPPGVTGTFNRTLRVDDEFGALVPVCSITLDHENLYFWTRGEGQYKVAITDECKFTNRVHNNSLVERGQMLGTLTRPDGTTVGVISPVFGVFQNRVDPGHSLHNGTIYDIVVLPAATDDTTESDSSSSSTDQGNDE